MGQPEPIRTGIPELVDLAGNISNTVDFHISSTNWINILDLYINHVACIYVWSHTKHTSDPVTQQAQFFQQMNDSAVPLRMKGVDEKVYFLGGKKIKGMYLSKLDTLLEPGWVWIRDDDGFPESRQTGANKEYHAFDLANRTDVWIEYDIDVQKQTLETIQNISDVWGMADLESDQEFLMYWTKKYRRSHKKVQQSFKEMLVTMGVPEIDNYFTTISDSIGLLSKTTYYPDTSIIPVIDVDFTLFGHVPAWGPSVIDNKLDNEVKDMLAESSLKTNTLFRVNQVPLVRASASPENSHGEDMVNDFIHYFRLSLLQGDLEEHVSEMLGVAYNMLEYMQISDNVQEINNPEFDLVVEDSIIKVDILKNKYHTLASSLKSRSKNDDVLKNKYNTTNRS